MPASLRPFASWIVAVLLAVAAAVGYGFRCPPPHPAGGDTPAYLSGAYHLRTHATFTQATADGPAPPAIGREPGYAALLAVLMAADPAFGTFTPACLAADEACPAGTYRVAQRANAVLIGLSGLALFAAAQLFGLGTGGALTAATYLWLNVQMNKGWFYLASDHLGVWLVTVAMLAAAWAYGGAACKGAYEGTWCSRWRWGVVGLALAALALTKAVFLTGTLLALAGAVAVAGFRPAVRRSVLTAALAVLLGFGPPVGGWMLRNLAAEGRLVLTDDRSGIALSTREVFNDMTAGQYVAAFVYWTRGFGDGLARRLFAPDVVEPLDLATPGGFYDRGQNGYPVRVAERAAALGLPAAEAMRRIDRELVLAILNRPFTHAAATLPVFYRGIWVDEFIVIGLPLFAWALMRAGRRRDWPIVLALSSGAFNLLFYALVSLNIPRYQMTAVPALALAAGLMLPPLGAAVLSRIRRDR